MKNKVIIGLVCIFLVGLVLADTNVSIQYGWNGTDYIPFKTTGDGRMMTDINKANFTVNFAVATTMNVSGNLTIGEGKLWYNNTAEEFYYWNRTGWTDLKAGVGSTPINAVMSFNQATCPTGWILADGTEGTPDLRGIFIRGAGTSGSMLMANGTNFSATFGEYMNDSYQEHKHTGNIDVTNNRDVGTGGNGFNNFLASTGTSVTAGAAFGEPRNGTETAPASYALIYCIKTGTEDAANSLFVLGTGLITLVNTTHKLLIDSEVNITGSLNLGNGSIWYNDSDAKYYYYNETEWLDIGSGSGSGEATKRSYTESGHGLSVGDAVYYNGSSHYKAIANDSDKLGTGIVSAVGGDSFDVTYSGYISGLSGLTTGSYYFVSPTTAGTLSTSSGSNYSNPLLQAISTTTGVMYNWRAVALSTGDAAVWENESGVATYVGGNVNITKSLYVGGDVNVTGNLKVTGNITGGSPVKIIGGLQVYDATGDVLQFELNKSTGNLNVDGDLNVSGDIFGNFTAQNNNYVYNGSDWVGAKATADGVQHIFLNDSSRKYDAVPENAVMSFNQASCPLGWSLADGTSGTPDLRGIFIRGAGTSGILQLANASKGNFSATYGEYSNDSFQGHGHQLADANGGQLSQDIQAGQSGSVITRDGATNPNSQTRYQTLNTQADSDGTPRTGTETAPASHALIYCVKTAEDAAPSNSIWQTLGNIISLVNSSKTLEVGNMNVTGNLTVNGRKNGAPRITEALWSVGNDYGSVNNMILKWTNEITASDDVVVTVTNTDTAGFAVLANMNCSVVFTYSADFAANTMFGISKNSSQLTTAVNSINATDAVMLTSSGAADILQSVIFTGKLNTGDVLRPHASGSLNGLNKANSRISVLAIERFD